MDQATDAKYATMTRVSGTAGYTGFWFFGASGRPPIASCGSVGDRPQRPEYLPTEIILRA